MSDVVSLEQQKQAIATREAASQNAYRLQGLIARGLRNCRGPERKVVRAYWEDPLKSPKEIGEAVGLSATKVSIIMRRQRVRDVIHLIDQEVGATLGVTAHKMIGHLAAVAFGDVRGLFNEDGSMKLPHEWSDFDAAAVESVETDELFAGSGREREQIGYTRKIKRASKLKAIELLMQIKKLGQPEKNSGVTINVDNSEKKIELINSIMKVIPAPVERAAIDVQPQEAKPVV